MSKELDDAYFRSTPCTHHEPLLGKLVDCVDLLEERIKGLLGAKVYVGETNTLPAGSEATASASKRGYDTVLDFGIPKGDKGDPGEPGPPGEPGAPGAPGAPGSDANVTKENVEAALGYEPLNAAYANNIYIMQKEIENLQGIAATEETDTTEAYTKTVPTGAQKWASLDSVGGKTVVWNQLEGLEISELNYPAWDMSNQTVTDGVLSGHLTGNYGGWNNRVEDRTPLTVGHKYLFLVDANFPVGIDMSVKIAGEGATIKTYGGTGAFQTMSVIQTATDGSTKWLIVQSNGFSDYDAQIKNPQIFDLTQMFGAGNEPSTVEEFRAMFPADYYPYNPGELISAEVVEVESKGTFPIPQSVHDMCPGYGWSAGTVCNEIDFGRKKYIQRVGSVDLGTLSYWNGSTTVSGKYRFGSDNVKDIKPITQNVVTKDLRYSARTYNYVDGIEISTQGVIYICDSRYEMAADFKAAMQGVLLYYEMAEPVEVYLSDVLPDDHFIEVEAGGTVTFKQASTQLPVPSAVTYQVSTKEAIANA